MNALELADLMEKYSVAGFMNPLADEFKQAANMLRQQQAEMEELEKENNDLRYLIATKLEQQDGISLNSMAHPITNTPEPSYEIDPDKLETIEIDLPSPEPVAWAVWEGRPHDLFFTKEDADELCRLKGGDAKSVPLYTHPVKEPLTNEEIEDEWFKVFKPETGIGKNLTNGVYEFAMAILRKAQDNG